MEEKIIKDIEKAKKKLIAKAKEAGIWENFGQKEVRELLDKYPDCMYTKVYSAIQDFDNWCMNFDLSDLNSIRLTKIEHKKYHEMRGVI